VREVRKTIVVFEDSEKNWTELVKSTIVITSAPKFLT
jgi:hypothetical protein